MVTQQQFTLPRSYKQLTNILLGVGVVVLLLGLFLFKGWEHVDHSVAHGTAKSTRFWAVLLQNSVYWLLVVNSAMFFICITTLAMGGWQAALKRVPEAISSVVPIIGIISFIVLMAIVWGQRTDIFHWLDKDAVSHDRVLFGKKGFLNPIVFTLWTTITIALWSLLGAVMRKLSIQTDNEPYMHLEQKAKWTKKNLTWASVFTVFFGLTVGSTIPWLWLMSIDAHWYSTMYSWYTFVSAFVAGISLIAILMIYLKGLNQLPYVTEDHMHDLGKFMFAFSIFWTYLWFSQYMLIWYSNQTEETRYFVDRIGNATRKGPYIGLFYFTLIINFLAPLFVLMTRGAKRNWRIITLMSIIIIFGHWLDFFLMVMPGTLGPHAELSWFELGVPFLFVGLIMLGAGKYINKYSLTQMNHPFLKESMIYHT